MVYRGLRDKGLKGLNNTIKHGLKGLSIVTLAHLTLYRQIVKAICRQIDKPYIPIAPYHRYKGLSSPLKSGGSKRKKIIPIGIYKPYMLAHIQDIRFGRFEGFDNIGK